MTILKLASNLINLLYQLMVKVYFRINIRVYIKENSLKVITQVFQSLVLLKV
jgi:hypothetical protein